MDKKWYSDKIYKEIHRLKKFEKIITIKKPSYWFFEPAIGNSAASLADLLCYLEEKNPYYIGFNEAFFNNRQRTVHRTFISDLHSNTEDGLREIIKNQDFQVEINRKNQAESIVEKLRDRLSSSEIKKILDLGGENPTFNDHLHAVLRNTKNLDSSYKKQCIIYFDGINILRNKISHSDMTLTEEEKIKLGKAKLGNAIAKDGKLQFTFEGYLPLLIDHVKFFDNINVALD